MSSDDSTVPGKDEGMAPEDPKRKEASLGCSFCGKSQKEVRKLIAGPSVCICDECIELCTEILREDLAKETQLDKLQDIRASLAQRVVGHTEQQRILATVLINHQRRQARPAISMKHKANALLVGPMGVGKSHLIEQLAKLMGMRVLVVEASRLDPDVTSSGTSIANTLREMGAAQGCDVLCIEHLERVASTDGSDRVGTQVQRALIDLMDGILIDGIGSHPRLDIRHCSVVCTLTLDGHEALEHRTPGGPTRGNPLGMDHATLIRMGLLPELVSRFSVICSFDPLSREELGGILRQESGLLDEYVSLAKLDGVTMSFADDALAELASLARAGVGGARSLRPLLESVLLEVSCTLAEGEPVEALEIDRAFVQRSRS